MKINIFYLSVVLSLSACENNNGIIPGTADVSNLDNIKKIEFKDVDTYPIGLYSDVFSEVHYVALESTESSIIGEIEKIAVTNNNDLLVFDYKNKSVLLFDSIGKFKNRIGIIGHAKNEFIEPLDMVYDEYNNKVIVYDNAKKSLIYYALDGKFNKSILLKEHIESFEVLDESHLVLYNGYKGMMDRDVNYNYEIIDTKGHVKKKFAPYDKTMMAISMTPYPFHKYEKKLYCHIEKTPIVNKITLDKMEPVFLIDFGTYQLSDRYFINGPETYNKKVVSLETNKAATGKFFQTGGYILMTFATRGNTPMAFGKIMITPREKLSQPIFYGALFNDLYGKQSSSNLLYASYGKVYYALNSESFNSLREFPSNTDVAQIIAGKYRNNAKKVTGEEQSIYNTIADVLESTSNPIVINNKEKDLIDSLSKSKNPVIQICTLKKDNDTH